MNRFEFLTLAGLLGIALVFFIKSKKFDNFIDWLSRGCKPLTIDKLSKDREILDKEREEIAKDLIAREKSVKEDKNKFKKL